ncbi:unnamed protein product, partial [Brachionus calyciflorus]
VGIFDKLTTSAVALDEIVVQSPIRESSPFKQKTTSEFTFKNLFNGINLLDTECNSIERYITS